MPPRLPPIIAALQLPSFREGPRRDNRWFEDYLIANATCFVEGGVTAIKLQDETRETDRAAAETIARMTALGSAFRRNFPEAVLGIIVQAHDPAAAIAIAAATDASFVRLKIFAGAAVNAEGYRTALGVEAVNYRASLGRYDIQILADAHDRTSVPAIPVPDERAALWTQALGADTLVITGRDFEDTIARVEKARAVGVHRPIYIGGGVDERNVARALAVADGAIVSSSLRRSSAAPNDLDQWDRGAVRRLMDAAAVG